MYYKINSSVILRVICPQNLKSKVGQTGNSLRAGYRCTAKRYCLLHVVRGGLRLKKQFQGPLPSPPPSGPQIQLGDLGERCKLLKRGPQTHFWHILSLGNASGGNNFGSYFTSHYPSENDNIYVK